MTLYMSIHILPLGDLNVSLTARNSSSLVNANALYLWHEGSNIRAPGILKLKKNQL